MGKYFAPNKACLSSVEVQNNVTVMFKLLDYIEYTSMFTSEIRSCTGS